MSNENAAAVKTAQKEPMSIDPKFILRLTGTLLGICLVTSLLLGVVNFMTEPIITAMQAEKTAAAMRQVLEAEEYLPMTSEVENVVAMHEAHSAEGCVGYVVEVTASGFGGAISMVVGVDFETHTVTGVAVTDDAETANVGTKVTKDQSVLDRFIDMSHEGGAITVNSGANRFDGISGATVSSKAVAAGVNTALEAVAAHHTLG